MSRQSPAQVTLLTWSCPTGGSRQEGQAGTPLPSRAAATAAVCRVLAPTWRLRPRESLKDSRHQIRSVPGPTCPPGEGARTGPCWLSSQDKCQEAGPHPGLWGLCLGWASGVSSLMRCPAWLPLRPGSALGKGKVSGVGAGGVASEPRGGVQSSLRVAVGAREKEGACRPHTGHGSLLPMPAPAHKPGQGRGPQPDAGKSGPASTAPLSGLR